MGKTMAEVLEDQAKQAGRAKSKGMAEHAPEGMGALAKLAEKLTAKPAHEPILKSLEKIGIIPLIVKMEGDLECFVIPVQLLIQKEYQHMTGLDVSKMVAPTDESEDSNEN